MDPYSKATTSNGLTYSSNAEIFSKFDSLMKQMEKHRAQLFQKVSENLNKGNVELRSCREKLDTIITKMNNLENIIDQSRDKWRQRHIHETELLASLQRTSSTSNLKETVSSPTLRSPAGRPQDSFLLSTVNSNNSTNSSSLMPSTVATPNFSTIKVQQSQNANLLAEKFLAKLNNTSSLANTPSFRTQRTNSSFTNVQPLESDV